MRCPIVNLFSGGPLYAVRMVTVENTLKAQLGARIRKLREGQGISQRTFCMMIGMDRSYLIAVELGRRNIAVENLSKIAAGLGVSLSYLFEGVGPQANEPACTITPCKQNRPTCR